MRKKAFTLIEVLIVIFVFWVGILAVLNMLTHSLAYFDSISTKTKADFLAKEGIEIAYNFRDSRIEEGLPWNYYTWTCGHEVYLWTEGFKTFKIGFSNNSNPYRFFQPESINNAEWKMSFDELFKKFALEIYTWDEENNIGYYRYTESDLEEMPGKWFARYIEFTPIFANGTEGTTLDLNKILKISSHTLYKRWSITWEVILESFIGMKDTPPAETSDSAICL